MFTARALIRLISSFFNTDSNQTIRAILNFVLTKYAHINLYQSRIILTLSLCIVRKVCIRPGVYDEYSMMLIIIKQPTPLCLLPER